MFEYSNIRFLVHVTSKKNLESIKKSGTILTNNELVKKKIDYTGGFSQKQTKIYDDFYKHYPGVYMTVFTCMSQKLLKNYKPKEIDDPVFILFNKELLTYRDDYHINTCDFNGYIIPPFLKEDRTFLSYQLPDFINYCNHNDAYGGEIVFHNKVFMKNFLFRILTIEDSIPKDNPIVVNIKKKIPKYFIKFTPLHPSYLEITDKEFLINYIYYLVDLGFINVERVKELLNVKSEDEISNSLICINQILENKFKEYRGLGYT